MDELTGRVAVVTGAASGIGRALAERWAAEGMRVVMADIEKEPLTEAADALRDKGSDVLAVPTDVSDGAQVDALADAAHDAYGSVHLLCNNAGVGTGGPVTELTTVDWEWVLGVNLWGVIHGLRAFLPGMLASRGRTATWSTRPRWPAFWALPGWCPTRRRSTPWSGSPSASTTS